MNLFPGIQPASASGQLARNLEAFETPPEAVDDLVYGRPDLVPEGAAIWEPCAGTQTLAQTLRRHGHEVVSTDIHDWGQGPYYDIRDVLEFRSPLAGTVVTNPPFKRAHEIIEHLLEIGVGRVIALHAWNWWLSSPTSQNANTAAVGQFFVRRPPSQILPLLRRVSLWRFDIPIHERGGTSPMRYAWYVFDAAHAGAPTCPWLPRWDRPTEGAAT